MEAIFKRRSIRKFRDMPVEQEKTERLLRAAMQAPSAGNQQPWEFLVVQNKDSLEELSKLSPYAKCIKNAPLALVLLCNNANMRYPENWQQDMGAAAQNILLEAVELGLGAVWIGVAPVEDREVHVKNMFDLKDNIIPYCVIPIGYPDGQENKFIDRFDETKIHYELFSHSHPAI